MKKFLIGISAVVFSVGAYYTFTDYSDGQRSGQIVKFSNKGSIPGCKTWEGELVVGGLRGRSSADDSGANLFHFTVSDRSVVEKVQRKLESGEHVLVKYRQPHWNWPCTTDTGYFVVEVK